MEEEIQGVKEDTRWRKAIPEARDRLQSRVLVAVVGVLLVWMTELTLQRYYVGLRYDPAPSWLWLVSARLLLFLSCFCAPRRSQGLCSEG
jgi:hypothetical protein